VFEFRVLVAARIWLIVLPTLNLILTVLGK